MNTFFLIYFIVHICIKHFLWRKLLFDRVNDNKIIQKFLSIYSLSSKDCKMRWKRKIYFGSKCTTTYEIERYLYITLFCSSFSLEYFLILVKMEIKNFFNNFSIVFVSFSSIKWSHYRTYIYQVCNSICIKLQIRYIHIKNVVVHDMIYFRSIAHCNQRQALILIPQWLRSQ